MEGLEDMEGIEVLWDALLKHAQENLAQSQALLAQLRSNEETSRPVHLLAQRMPSKGAIDKVPDKLVSWYVAECDASGHCWEDCQAAEGVLDPDTGASERVPAPSQRPLWERRNGSLPFLNC